MFELEYPVFVHWSGEASDPESEQATIYTSSEKLCEAMPQFSAFCGSMKTNDFFEVHSAYDEYAWRVFKAWSWEDIERGNRRLCDYKLANVVIENNERAINDLVSKIIRMVKNAPEWMREIK